MKQILQAIFNFLRELFSALKEDSIKLPHEEVTQDWDGLVKAYKSYDKADHFKIASLAQWILESGRGESRLAKEALNFGGLKWRDEMRSIATPLTIKVPSEPVPVAFCMFKSVEDFIRGYWVFIGRSPYKGWSNCKDAFEFLEHIFEAGYAADPRYLEKVKSLVPEAASLLGLEVEEPDRPSRPPVATNGYVVPTIVRVAGVRYQTQGHYRTPSGMCMGMIWHYTVSRRSKEAAINVVKYLARQGLGCPVMDRDGIIYIPENFDIYKDVAWHAGKSKWKGKTGLSRYLTGMEVCNAGKLIHHKNKWYPAWCFENWSPSGKFLGGRSIPNDEVRIVGNNDNLVSGAYQTMTDKQESAIFNYALMHLYNNPEFKAEWNLGHDEVRTEYLGRKGGKQDPGGSLSMTMSEAREKLGDMYAKEV